jgi:hypothetical protein
MAGEWVPIDLAIETKPEVLRLLAKTGLSREVVVYRLWKLWGWFSLNSSDGTIDATPELLALACGGDADWWRAVEAVGWLQFDLENERATLPGWDARFSKAAKARLLNARRQSAYREAKDAENTDETSCNASVTHGRYAHTRERNGLETLNRGDRGEENRGEEGEDYPLASSTASADALPAQGSRKPHADAWQALRRAWNDGAGQRWQGSRAPREALQRLAEPGWLTLAVEAIPKLATARYFVEPVTLTQFCGDGFAERLANDHYSRPKRSASRHGNEERLPPREFTGADAEAFRRTEAALAARRAEAAT